MKFDVTCLIRSWPSPPTSCGSRTATVLPTPSCPSLLLPQAQTSPSHVRANVCSEPTDTSLMKWPAMASTCWGRLWPRARDSGWPISRSDRNIMSWKKVPLQTTKTTMLVLTWWFEAQHLPTWESCATTVMTIDYVPPNVGTFLSLKREQNGQAPLPGTSYRLISGTLHQELCFIECQNSPVQ